MASLYVVRGRDQGKHFLLETRSTRLGRESSCAIRLQDSEASRVHAELRPLGDGRFQLVDLQSSNGTLVNGQRVEQCVLRSGDRVEIGGTLLIFTGTAGASVSGAGHGVDIIAHGQSAGGAALTSDGSRIVSSVSGSGSLLALGNAAASRQFEDSDESRRRADRNLELMYLTALAVGRTDSIPELLDRVLRLVFDWVDADRGCVMLRQGDSDRLVPAARCDRDAEGAPAKPQGRISISHTILDYVIERKEGVRTSDARDDIRFDAANSIVQGGVREALCVPLQGRYAVVGALYVDTYTSPGKIVQSGYQARFTDEQLRLMTAIGYQAALAIEDAHYYSAMVQSERLAAMGQTIATLSHHIKNILQGMRGGGFLIDEGLKRDDSDAVRRGWGIVERNQERISNLVMDMLTFSKERQPELVEADLNETVADVVELMRSRAEAMEVQLTFAPDADLPPARFDPDALHRAVLNIVTNAIDAAADQPDPEELAEQQPDRSLQQVREAGVIGQWDHWQEQASSPLPSAAPPASAADPGEAPVDRLAAPAGRVVVTTSHDRDDGWTICVADNGPGIAEEDRQQIFSVFESRKGSRGTGLGLPVSDKILREHGGRIELSDSYLATPPGRTGTCFRLRLPAERGDQAAATAEETMA